MLALTVALALGTSGAALGDELASRFAERLDPAALDGIISGLTAVATKAPRDPQPRLQLARAQELWTELHGEATAADAIAHLSAGVESAREALALLSPGYVEAARQGRSLAQALQAIEPAGAIALYWIAADQHRLAAQRGLAALLLETDDLRRLFARVIELAPETFHGGAYLHEAELALAMPAGYAASLETASDDLAQAERLGAGWLRVDLVWAERWAVKAQDYGLFQRKLQKVLQSPADAQSDLAPENELAKRQAKALLASAQLLFTRAAIHRGEATAGGKR